MIAATDFCFYSVHSLIYVVYLECFIKVAIIKTASEKVFDAELEDKFIFPTF